MGPLLRDAEGGADTTVWLSAVQPQPRSGQLWHDRRARPTHLLAPHADGRAGAHPDVGLGQRPDRHRLPGLESAHVQENDRDESRAERLDRNWIELIQELRVAQTGVQVLAGFLLTLPFSARFLEHRRRPIAWSTCRLHPGRRHGRADDRPGRPAPLPLRPPREGRARAHGRALRQVRDGLDGPDPGGGRGADLRRGGQRRRRRRGRRPGARLLRPRVGGAAAVARARPASAGREESHEPRHGRPHRLAADQVGAGQRPDRARRPASRARPRGPRATWSAR